MSVQLAKAELDKMLQSLRAFEGARQVLDVLANIDQVTSETRARNDVARADLAVAEDKLRVARETSETLLSHAKAIVAEAEAKARDIVAQAKGAADLKIADAEAQVYDMGRDIQERRDELESLAPLVAAGQAELADIEGKLVAAKEAYRKALEG